MKTNVSLVSIWLGPNQSSKVIHTNFIIILSWYQAHYCLTLNSGSTFTKMVSWPIIFAERRQELSLPSASSFYLRRSKKTKDPENPEIKAEHDAMEVTLISTW